jgi:integrase
VDEDGARRARGRQRRVTLVAYGYDVRINGKRERKWEGEWHTPADARAALAKREAEIAAGRVDLPEARTLRQVADEYLAFKTHQGKRTVSEDRRILETRLLPAFGAMTPVRSLTAAAIAQYEARQLGEVSASTVANQLAVLKHMLRLARKWGHLDQVPEIEMPKRATGRLRCLDEAEIARLLAACRTSRNPHLWIIATVAINAGMRKEEILGLEWEGVDLSTARLALPRTKSGKRRGVPMNRAVYDALTALEPEAAKRRGFLFRKHDERRWGQIRRAWEGAVKRAGLVDFHFNDLRHTAPSYMVMRGASLADVKEILGHADLKMMMRYAHLSPAHLRTAVDRLDGLTAGTATPAATIRDGATLGHTNGHTMVESGASAA